MAIQTQYLNNLPAGMVALKEAQICRLQGREECPSDFYVGGVRGVLFALQSELGFVYVDAAGQVTGFENNSVTKWVNLYFKIRTGSLSTAWQFGEFGEIYESTLGFTVGYKNPVNRNVLYAFVKREVVAIVFDLNGGAWLVGWDFGFKNPALTDQTGAAESDLNGYAVTLKCRNRIPPRRVTDAALANLILDYSQNCNQPFAQTIPLLSLQACELDAYNLIPLF